MASPSRPRHYRPEEYLTLERQAQYKSEYVADNVQPSPPVRQPFIVLRQPLEPGYPGEILSAHRASGQQHEAAGGPGQFDAGVGRIVLCLLPV